MGDLGVVLLKMGLHSEAQAAVDEALQIYDSLQMGHTTEYFDFLTALAQVKSQLSEREECRRLAEAALQLAQRLRLTESHPRIRVRENLAILMPLTEQEEA